MGPPPDASRDSDHVLPLRPWWRAVRRQEGGGPRRPPRRGLRRGASAHGPGQRAAARGYGSRGLLRFAPAGAGTGAAAAAPDSSACRSGARNEGSRQGSWLPPWSQRLPRVPEGPPVGAAVTRGTLEGRARTNENRIRSVPASMADVEG